MFGYAHILSEFDSKGSLGVDNWLWFGRRREGNSKKRGVPMRSTVSVLVATLTIILIMATATGADTVNTKISNQIAEWTLPDCYGKSVSLRDFKDSKLVVVAF